jgi:hypothetical protein
MHWRTLMTNNARILNATDGLFLSTLLHPLCRSSGAIAPLLHHYCLS